MQLNKSGKYLQARSLVSFLSSVCGLRFQQYQFPSVNDIRITLAQTVRAQADAQLRPGADASRADAELAAARTQVSRAQQATEVARAVLAQFVGVDPAQITLAAPKLLQLPPSPAPQQFNTAANPIAVEQNAAVEQAKAQLNILDKSYYPRFFTQGSAYARGTGAAIDGTRLGGVNGLTSDVQNYAA